MKTDICQDASEGRRCFKFCFPALDTAIELKNFDGRVMIRATRDTFSERRKVSFIRELAAEGFIDESYRWFSGFEGSFLPIRWSIHHSWLIPDKAARSRTSRFMIRLLACATLVWLVSMGVLFCSLR